jgi:hypothetical protein
MDLSVAIASEIRKKLYITRRLNLLGVAQARHQINSVFTGGVKFSRTVQYIPSRPIKAMKNI